MDLKPGPATVTITSKLVAVALLAWATVGLLPLPAQAASASSGTPAGNSVTTAPATPTAVTARVTLVGPLKLETTPGPNPWLTALLSALAALGGSLVGYWSTRSSSRAGIIQKTNELEVESIDRRLSEFVGPFLQLSEENKTLADELKRKQAGSPDSFRTLTALLTPGWRDGLSTGDANLLEVVVENGVELRRLLMEKGSTMVSPALLPYFGRASSHFRFLELAYKGSLDPDPDRYSAYVYPRELDGILERERIRLETRRELLRSAPSVSHPRMKDLEIPAAARISGAPPTPRSPGTP